MKVKEIRQGMGVYKLSCLLHLSIGKSCLKIGIEIVRLSTVGGEWWGGWFNGGG